MVSILQIKELGHAEVYNLTKVKNLLCRKVRI